MAFALEKLVLKDCLILACVILIQYQHVTDRQTPDGDMHADHGYSSALDSVSYAAALQKSHSASKCSQYRHLKSAGSLAEVTPGQDESPRNKLKLLFIA